MKQSTVIGIIVAVVIFSILIYLLVQKNKANQLASINTSFQNLSNNAAADKYANPTTATSNSSTSDLSLLTTIIGFL